VKPISATPGERFAEEAQTNDGTLRVPHLEDQKCRDLDCAGLWPPRRCWVRPRWSAD